LTKIIAISDTHSYHRRIKIPDGDFLIHAGDITYRGEMHIIKDFAIWLKQFPHKKIVIFGNHELGLEEPGAKKTEAIQMIVDSGAIYLEDNVIEIDGIHFHGSPITPWFYSWAYNRQRGQEIKRHWDLIPNATDVLITHGPPYMIMDKVPFKGINPSDNVGCEDLMNKINVLPNLKAHIFGHIHDGWGMIEKNGIKFVNAACCTEQYQPINKPITFEI